MDLCVLTGNLADLHLDPVGKAIVRFELVGDELKASGGKVIVPWEKITQADEVGGFTISLVPGRYSITVRSGSLVTKPITLPIPNEPTAALSALIGVFLPPELSVIEEAALSVMGTVEETQQNAAIAEAWAESPLAPGVEGTKSSKTHASEAAVSAGIASTAASGAAASEGVALAQAGIATTKAGEASDSAVAALDSQGAAETAALSTSQDRTQTGLDATAAASSAGAAATSETNAGASASSASTSAGAASTSAQNANTSAGNAAASATAAGTSETNAAGSAGVATTRAGEAAASATTAAEHAASLDPANVAITGGTINGTDIGNVVPASIKGTSGEFEGNVGIGTDTPSSRLQVAFTPEDVAAALITSDALLVTGQGTPVGVSIAVAGSNSGQRGVFKATRAGGTLENPTAPAAGDEVLSILGAIYDGMSVIANAGITFGVDGSVSPGVGPQRMTFMTGAGSTREERMRITAGGDIGINTNTPKARLHIDRIAGSFSVPANIDGNTAILTTPGTVNDGSGSALSLLGGVSSLVSVNFGDKDSGVMGRLLYRHSEDSLAFWVNGSERVKINSNGFVGIGTGSPAATLHLSRDTAMSIYLDRTGASPSLASIDNASAALQLKYDSGGGIQFHTGVTPTERMRVAQDGNVGINVSNPTERLHVVGGAYVTGNVGIARNPPPNFWGSGNNSALHMGQGSLGSQGGHSLDITANGYRNNSGTWTTLNTNNSKAAAGITVGTQGEGILFRTNAVKDTGSPQGITERMRIDSTGKVGIGTSNPTSALTVQGTITGTAVTQSNTDTTAGRLMKVGDFGLGGLIPSFPGNDLGVTDNSISTGIYRADGALDMPDTLSRGSLIHTRRASGGGETQLLLEEGFPQRIFSRGRSTGNWASWKYFNPTLGAVSQSSGVPTGAVIQRGSNSNGEFVRFADGTQICRRMAFVELAAGAQESFSFAAMFAGTGDDVSVSIGWRASSANAAARAGTIAQVGTTPNSAVILNTTTTAFSGAHTAMIFAFGRWF